MVFPQSVITFGFLKSCIFKKEKEVRLQTLDREYFENISAQDRNLG